MIVGSSRNRWFWTAIALPIALATAVGTLGCSGGEEPPEEPQAQAEEARLREALERMARFQSGQETDLPEYTPNYAPEIEDLLVEIRFYEIEEAEILTKLELLLVHEHAAVREEVVSKLEDIGRLGKEGSLAAIALLGQVLTGDESNVVRLRAVEALDYIGTPEAADQLVQALRDQNPNVRRQSVDALNFHGTVDHAPALRAALAKEEDPAMQEELRDALQSRELQAPEGAKSDS